MVLRYKVIITLAITPLKTESGMFINRNVTITALALTLLSQIKSTFEFIYCLPKNDC